MISSLASIQRWHIPFTDGGSGSVGISSDTSTSGATSFITSGALKILVYDLAFKRLVEK